MSPLQRSMILLSLCLPTLAGCGSREPDPRGVRVGVSGRVQLNGEPLSRARILFKSNAGTGGVTASALIENGTFKIDSENGPVPGTARVEVYPELLELAEFEQARGGNRHKVPEARVVEIPARYNLNSELTADVSDGRPNVFRFTLSSK